MNKKAKKRLLKIALISLVALPVFGLVSLQIREKNIEKTLSSIPQPPQSKFFSEFFTSWPDDTPSRGFYLKTDANPQDISDFYLREMAQRGWQVTGKYINDDPAMPIVLNLKKKSYSATIIIGGIHSPDRISIRLEKKFF